MKKVIVITGCSSGLGKAICQEIDHEKYVVVATARNTDDLSDVAADRKLCIDVSRDESIRKAVETIIYEYQRIDVLVNNAGFSVRAAVEEIDLDVFKNMLDVNVLGNIRMMQAVLPYMRKQKSGRIVNIGSVSGRMVSSINGGYCASKYAMEAISDAVRSEVMEMGIQVTILEPGAMETPFFEKLAEKSASWMQNSTSPYAAFYKRDYDYRLKQSRASVRQSAKKITHILEKRYLKARYPISVLWTFRLYLCMPEQIKEMLMKMEMKG